LVGCYEHPKLRSSERDVHDGCEDTSDCRNIARQEHWPENDVAGAQQYVKAAGHRVPSGKAIMTPYHEQHSEDCGQSMGFGVSYCVQVRVQCRTHRTNGEVVAGKVEPELQNSDKAKHQAVDEHERWILFSHDACSASSEG
jgi:hypothetical protein